LSRRPPKDLPAGEGWQPVLLLLLLLLLLPLRAPPRVHRFQYCKRMCGNVRDGVLGRVRDVNRNGVVGRVPGACRPTCPIRKKADGAPSRFFCPDVRSPDPVSAFV
jgi:hypothetical protein